jgi:class 3 adenylate cyclase
VADLSIKSRLLVMLLGVSALSIAIVASLSYYASYNALRDSVFNHLTSLRAIKAERIETYLNDLQLEAGGIAEGPLTQTAAAEFIRAFRELQEIGENPQWDAQLGTFYADEFIPRLDNRLEGRPSLAAHLPATPVARYLQHRYIAANRFPVKAKQQLTEIVDDNAYARTHARHHPQFRRTVEKLGYYDLFIIDIETGDIVYSVAKEVDFATNLIDGPYDISNLAELFRSIQRTPDQGVVRIIDYARYRPSHSRSQAFVAAPIFVDGKAIGVLALQISDKEIKQVMTGGGHWERDGLGKTGETILVGDDHLMRSHSRFLIEDPESYARDMRAFHMDEAAIARMLEFESSILIQPVRTLAADEALQGRTGTGVIEDYRGEDILASWAPLNISDFRWAIIGKMDLDEAFAPMRRLARATLIQSVLIMLAITLIVMLLASSFVRPVNELINRVRQAGLGDEDVQIDTKAKDEFGDLARSFKDMVESVRDQTRLVQETNRENERLLQSVLPESVARRLKRGEKDIADSVPDVSVLFADLGGFTQFCDSVPAHESVALLNELVSTFDDATGRFGIEKIKTFGDTYMAACGLCTPLLDHTRRAIDFARELHRAVRRFNAEHALDLRLTVGISAGPVVAGIVGRDKFIYDVWGETVLQADLARKQASPRSIVVTTAVRDKVEDLYSFRRLETADTGIPLWCLSEVKAKTA